MEIITFEEAPRYDIETAKCIGVHGTARLTFEAAYDITKEAFDRGLDNEQREKARQNCKKAIIAMLHDAIEKLEGGEE